MPKMDSTEVIRVHVHDDGDIELTKIPHSPNNRINYPSDLFYNAVEILKCNLEAELMSYGTEQDRAKEAIDEVINSHQYISVTV